MKVHRKRVRKVEYTDAPLEHLLHHEEAEPVRVEQARQESWIPKAGLHAFVFSAVAYTLFHILGLAPPYPLILAVCVGGVLVRRAVAFAREPRSRTRDVIRAPKPPRAIGAGGWYVNDDGMAEAIRRWDRRLEWGSTAPERFRHTITGRLAELVDERLRQRHGVTLAGDPRRARALVGDDVWRLIAGPADRVPRPRDVYQIVQRMESL
jgi:hypothetical protein